MSGAKDVILGGWQLNSIFQARTGLALTVWDSAGQSLQATRSNERPNRVCNGRIDGAGVDDRWLDINCFQHAPAGQFGDSGSGILYGPGFWNWDLGLSKDVRFDDKRFLTFRIEAFNVLNHPNFALQQGSANIGDPAELRTNPQHVLGAENRGARGEVHLLAPFTGDKEIRRRVFEDISPDLLFSKRLPGIGEAAGDCRQQRSPPPVFF